MSEFTSITSDPPSTVGTRAGRPMSEFTSITSDPPSTTYPSALELGVR
jgi:hypothetical protein